MYLSLAKCRCCVSLCRKLIYARELFAGIALVLPSKLRRGDFMCVPAVGCVPFIVAYLKGIMNFQPSVRWLVRVLSVIDTPLVVGVFRICFVHARSLLFEESYKDHDSGESDTS